MSKGESLDRVPGKTWRDGSVLGLLSFIRPFTQSADTSHMLSGPGATQGLRKRRHWERDRQAWWKPMARRVRGQGRGPEAHSPDVQVQEPLQSCEAQGQHEHRIQGQTILTEAGESQG